MGVQTSVKRGQGAVGWAQHGVRWLQHTKDENLDVEHFVDIFNGVSVCVCFGAKGSICKITAAMLTKSESSCSDSKRNWLREVFEVARGKVGRLPQVIKSEFRKNKKL